MLKFIFLILIYLTRVDSFVSKNLPDCGVKTSNDFKFPWMSLVINKKSGEKSIGVLVSDIHVVTKANAISYYDAESFKFYAVNPSTIEVKVGLHFMYSIRTKAKRFLIHPDIRVVNGMRINNVAIITLHAKVLFHKNNFMKPICMWMFKDDVIDKSLIYSVGLDEDQLDGIKYSNVSIVDQNYCRGNYSKIFPNALSQTKTFCIANEDNFCNANDAILVKYEERWYLRGIYSKYLRYKGSDSCIIDKPILYEDIAPLTTFLQCTVVEHNEFKKIVYL